jgi:hypothetical protein
MYSKFAAIFWLFFFKLLSEAFHKAAIASLISASVLPLAIAFSMRASEIFSFEPSASKSLVKGISNFSATSLTFSLLMSDGDVPEFY